ncbi:MAG: TlpA disulfide reductase family protein [Pseudomonadota bacterium]
MSDPQKKQKLMSRLTVLGFGFMIAVAVSYFINAPESTSVTKQVEMPRAFERQFSNVVTKRRAEDIVQTVFADPEKTPVSWNNFNGEYLLVNFWATWCGPCVVELPSIERLANEFEGKGMKVIAVSVDFQRSHDEVKEFLLNRGIGEFAAYFDQNKDIQNKIAMRGIPTTFLLSPEGKLLYIFEGDAKWHSPPAIQFFNNLLTAEADQQNIQENQSDNS